MNKAPFLRIPAIIIIVQLSNETIERIKERNDSAGGSYSEGACLNSEAVRRKNSKPEDPYLRPPFFRDIDRIIHSRAYSRYIDKTQVFYFIDNEHITHRSIHVQLVSKIARTIGRALGYNEDLIEAAALGHDIGHTPFGHTGEKFLDRLCKSHGIGGFMHNVQSVRFLDRLEECDLTLQVLDAILCHNGEVTDCCITPGRNFSWEHFDEKPAEAEKGTEPFPETFEGCIVRFADTIAYLGRDLLDAIEVGLVKRSPDDIPASFNALVNSSGSYRDINGLIIDSLCRDIIETSIDTDCISFSDEAYNCVVDLKNYNYRNIYENERLHEQDYKIENMFRTVFEHYLSDVECENRSSLVYRDLIDSETVPGSYIESLKPAEIVRDYIAGMTNRYFESVFKKIILPERKFRDFG